MVNVAERFEQRIRERVRCGACGGKVGRVNLMELNYRADWPYPTSGNVLTGESGRAVAIVCDACIDAAKAPKEAVEFKGRETVIYHPLESLTRLPPPRTWILVPGPGRAVGIRCLICGRTSYSSEDVTALYCGHCHRFHEDPAEAEPEQTAK